MTAPATLDWWEHGEDFFTAALDRLAELFTDDLPAPAAPAVAG